MAQRATKRYETADQREARQRQEEAALALKRLSKNHTVNLGGIVRKNGGVKHDVREVIP